MSRLAFRTVVALPRPRAAIAMVALATTTLAITGQVAAPALVAAALALGYVAWRGDTHAAWRTNPWVLNSGLAACLALGAALWLRGALAIVALAHFAVLAQPLQLFDARPRRSEFLLVALAVFQVTIAANLTDSAWYPLLLVAFTVCCVWTLVAHTLRAEAIEAGEMAAAQRVLTTGLWRTTLLASLASVAFSALLFPILPRIRSGAIFERSAGGGGASAGFSDRVELGEIGRIRRDPSVAMRVETLEGPALGPADRYWRGLAFDAFDGRAWSVSPAEPQPVYGDPEIGVDLGGPRVGTRVVQRIVREGVDPGVVFAPARPTLLRGGIGRLLRDGNGSLLAVATSNKRVLYEVVSRPPPRDLRGDVAEPRSAKSERYLQLPPLDPRIAALAREITVGAKSDAERVLLAERWLREHGRYTDSPPAIRAGTTPVEQFLLERTEGHCEYFASAHVVLLRTLGIPARVVNGYAGGHDNALGSFVEVTQSDAHAWVEVWFARSGWVPFDPTPPDQRLAGADALRGGTSLSEIASAVELWWFQNVVDFDRSTQARALRDLWMHWNHWRAAHRDGGDAPELPTTSTSDGVRVPWLWLGAAGLAAFAGWKLRGARRRRRGEALPPDYDRALRMLRRRGMARGPSIGARDFARSVGARLPAEAAQAFAALTESYLAERFGDRRAPSGARELATLRAALRRSARG